MAAVKIDGKVLAAQVKEEVAQEVIRLKARGIEPCLAVIQVGNNPASTAYVNGKERDCGECGIKSLVLRLPEETTQVQLLETMAKLTADPTVHGLLVQLPLPKHISEEAVIEAIPPEKDVDGFTPINVGNMTIGKPCFLPCTPAGCIRMIQSTGVSMAGKQAVVLGRSNIVGKPGECYGHHLPQQDPKSERDLPTSGYSGGSHRKRGFRYRRYDQGRRCGHRCGNQPWCRR